MTTAAQRWGRRLAWAHAATRTAIGIGMLASPRGVARSWVGDLDSPATRVTLAAFAVRDTGIGVGLLWSLARNYPVRHWFALGTAFEAVETATILANRRQLPSGWTHDAWNVLGVIGMLGGAVVAVSQQHANNTPRSAAVSNRSPGAANSPVR